MKAARRRKTFMMLTAEQLFVAGLILGMIAAWLL